MNNDQNVPDFLKPLSPDEALKKFTIDLTRSAEEKKLDPVIGREAEIRRVMEILSRRTKNNPILIGDPGVGKTAIVEGLAQRIISGQVPTTLKDKRVLVLDFAQLLAGAKFKGEFEERIKGVIKAVEESEGKYVVFIDELHTLVGGGASEGSSDAANILKPSLARGTLRMIGATTIGEYRKYIEKDPALARRFQPVTVDEPTTEDSVAILRGLKERYELHHGIRITDNAIIAAVKLSSQYIPHRFLPDKAIDLIDEAAAAIKIETESTPTELDELKRKITHGEIELAALKKEKTDLAQAKFTKRKDEIDELKAQAKELEDRWREQKDVIQKMQTLKAQLDALRIEFEHAQESVDLQKAAEIQYGKIPEVQKELDQVLQEFKKIPDDKKVLREEVDERDIAKVVTRWTGIPTARLLSSEQDRLTKLEDILSERVVGQHKAVVALARAIRRSRTGLSEKNKPTGSFLFLGPTGVGKTETARALAFALFSDEHAMTRIDMSEYSEQHSVARLIGAPPGYVGYEEGGQLTEAVRRKPYSVVLLDEIEKAHPQVLNVLLQLLDEGRLTDGKGTTVDFRNTIVIMTSNAASDIIQGVASGDGEKIEEEVLEYLRRQFRPEFLNRLDAIIIYNTLSPEDLEKITRLQLEKVRERLAENAINLEITDEIVKYFAKAGYDPVFGARPLRRLIEEKLVDAVAMDIVEEKVKPGDSITPKISGDIIELSPKFKN